MLGRWAIALVFILSACAQTPQTDSLLASYQEGTQPPGLPVRHELTDVPFFPQEAYYCGPAALAMVLKWGGVETTQDEIAKLIYTPGRQGTLRSDVLGGARRHGRLAVTVHTLGNLLTEIAAGHPVIVFQNLGLDWFQRWHFAVAIGYDLQARHLILHSGLNKRKVMPLTVFENTWRRGDFWALVVLPPDEIPATGTENEILDAAVAIERVGAPDAALAAYDAILERWPNSVGARFGRGNALYAQGSLTDAEMTFRALTVTNPEAGPAWNNLAVVLHKLGRQQEAISAAQTAIRTGNGDVEEYRRTLAEIQKPAV